MTTLQSYINSTTGPAASDLAPLVANETYRRAVDAELSARENAAAAAAAVSDREEHLANGVQPFANAAGALRAVAKRFPETSKHIEDAVHSLQLAMGLVAYNPPPIAEARTVNATGATPTPTAWAGVPRWQRKQAAQQQAKAAAPPPRPLPPIK
jgi:hypothetical protein